MNSIYVCVCVSVSIHIVIYIARLCMISLAKYYFMIHLCCVFDSNNFFIATVFYFINSPFLTILVFVGI